MPQVNSPLAVHDRFETLPLADLVPYARNSRTHSESQVQQIAASIREFGFTAPILIDEHNGVIAGHGRIRGAQLVGLRDVPCIRLVGLTEAQKRAYVIADNKLALNAGWDEDLLRSEFQALRQFDFDLSLLGFDDEELAAVFEPAPPDESKDPDVAPDPPEKAEAVTQVGDVWRCGVHRVACGDCRSGEVWDRLMQGRLVDVVWTDPPYNVAYDSKLAGKIKNDDMADAEFLRLLLDSFAALSSVLKPGGGVYVAHADTEGLNFRRAFRDAGFKLSGCLIWRKDSLVLGRSDYQWQHEPILYGWKPGRAHRWYGGRKQTTIQEIGAGSPFERQEDGTWAITVGDRTLIVAGDAKLVCETTGSLLQCDKPRRSAAHPTMKPVALIEKMLRFSARSGDLVADAFGGSGSTLMAAERLGMCARVVELEGRFCDVIVRRWQNYTGLPAVHDVTGEAFPLAPELGAEV